MPNRKGIKVTHYQLTILALLIAAEDSNAPYPTLTEFDKRSLNALKKRDWIVALPATKVDPNTRYRITGRGKQIYQDFQTEPIRHYDGLCPRCRTQPLYHYSTGKSSGYCRDCDRIVQREKRTRNHAHRRTGQICPQCKQNERHIAKSGYVRAFCRECDNQRKNQYKKDVRARLLERAAAGLELPLCRRCKAQPIVIYGNTPSDYCHDCAITYQRTYRQRTRYTRWNKKEGA